MYFLQVAGVVGRAETLSTFFFLLSIFCYQKAVHCGITGTLLHAITYTQDVTMTDPFILSPNMRKDKPALMNLQTLPSNTACVQFKKM